MEYTLQFLLMIDGPTDRAEIVDRILGRCAGVLPVKPNALNLQSNLIEVWANADADMTRSSDPLEGYMYYAYRVECTPIENVTEDTQIELAKNLISTLTAGSWKVVPCANFEDKL